MLRSIRFALPPSIRRPIARRRPADLAGLNLAKSVQPGYGVAWLPAIAVAIMVGVQPGPATAGNVIEIRPPNKPGQGNSGYVKSGQGSARTYLIRRSVLDGGKMGGDRSIVRPGYSVNGRHRGPQIISIDNNGVKSNNSNIDNATAVNGVASENRNPAPEPATWRGSVRYRSTGSVDRSDSLHSPGLGSMRAIAGHRAAVVSTGNSVNTIVGFANSGLIFLQVNNSGGHGITQVAGSGSGSPASVQDCTYGAYCTINLGGPKIITLGDGIDHRDTVGDEDAEID